MRPSQGQRETTAQRLAERIQQLLNQRPPLRADSARLGRLIAEAQEKTSRAASADAAAPLRVHACPRCRRQYFFSARCCHAQTVRSVTVAAQPVTNHPDLPPAWWSLIVLTKNRLDLTRAAVASIEKAMERTPGRFEWVFVDGGSDDGTLSFVAEVAQRHPVRLIVCPAEEPFIFARNCNRGAAAATGEYLVFANNDVVVRDLEVFNKLSAALQNPTVGVVGVQTDAVVRNPLQQVTTPLHEAFVFSVRPVMGFFWALRRQVYWELGGMDEQFDGYGCDEIDLQYRLIQRGYRIAVADAFVHHELFGTFGRYPRAEHRRNLAKFERKHGCRLFHPQPDQPFLDFYAAHPLPPKTSLISNPQPLTPHPFISIVIPCYGRQELFNDTLWSCLEQEYEDFEVVVVDDGSPQPIRIPYPAEKVRLYRLPENRGESYARNFGVQQARGVYIKFMDSDDLFLDRSSLRRWAEFAQHTGADFIYSEALLFDVGGGRVGAFRTQELDDRIYRGNFLAPSQIMVKRSVCLEHPFPEDLRYGEDFAFVVNLYAAQCYDCRRLPQRLIIVRLNLESQSQAYRGIGERYLHSIERARLREGKSHLQRHQPPDRVPPPARSRKREKTILLHRPERQALGHLLETLGHANYLLRQHPNAVVYLKLSEVAASYAQELLYCDDRVFLWSPSAPQPEMEVEFDYRYAHYPRRLVLDPLERHWAEQNVDPDTIIICPGSGMPLQTPPLSLWVELVQRFPPDQPFLFTGRWTGAGHKTSNLSPVALAEAFADRPNVRFLFDVPLMRQVCAVKRARCFVSGHTGFMFVPDAVGTPFVIANSFVAPFRFAGAPYIYVHPHQSCYPCNRHGPNQSDGLCLRRPELTTTEGVHFPCAHFDVEAVYRAIEEIRRGRLTVEESQRRVDEFMRSLSAAERISVKLHLGCGRQRRRGYINCDVQQLGGADFLCPAVPLPFTSGCAGCVESYHLIEHLSRSEAEAALREWYRVLKPGGRLVIECPDLRAVAREFGRGNDERLPVIYGLDRFPGDQHRWGYTAESLKALAEGAGFVKVKVTPGRDYHAKIFPCLRLEARKP